MKWFLYGCVEIYCRDTLYYYKYSVQRGDFIVYWLWIPLFISGIAGFVYIIYVMINNERKIQYNKRNALLLKQNTETVISIAKSRGYFVIMDRVMNYDRHMIYHGTSTVVNNFKVDKFNEADYIKCVLLRT